jgi:hypothetical protein
MTDYLSEELQDWTEANILPSSPAQLEALLVGVVDRLIHEALSGRIESCITSGKMSRSRCVIFGFGCSGAKGQGGEGRDALTRYLHEAELTGRLWRWYLGDNGVPGGEYGGEAAGYGGPEMWRVTYRDWQAGSDLALALLKLDAEGPLANGREFHLERRVHLHSNRLGLSYFEEGSLYLRLAIGYFAHTGLAAIPDGANVLRILSQINDAIHEA